MYKRKIFGLAVFIALILIISAGFALYPVLAIPPTTQYAPGETTDPACSPGDSNCSVFAPITSSSIDSYAVTSLSGDGGLSISNATGTVVLSLDIDDTLTTSTQLGLNLSKANTWLAMQTFNATTTMTTATISYLSGGTASLDNFLAGVGSASAPAYSFASDPDTGFYNIGADNIGLTLGGTTLLDFSTAGIALTKLGTATDANTTFNSPVQEFQSSVWDTDGSEDTWKFKFRNVPTSGGTTSAVLNLVTQKNSGTETNSFIFASSGSFLTASTIASGNGVFSAGASSAYGATIRGYDANDASAVGVVLDNNIALDQTGGKIVSFQNGGVEKSYINKDGFFTVGTSFINGTSVYGSYVYHGAGGLQNATASSPTLVKGRVASGSGATAAVDIDSQGSLATAGDRLLNIKNATVVKAYIDYLGSFNAGAGTALLPAYSFVGDPDTGIYNLAADQIGFSRGGSQTAKLTASGFQVNTILPNDAVSMTVSGLEANGATAKGVVLNASTAFTTPGAKLVSIQNAGVEKAYFSYDGGLYIGSSILQTTLVYGPTLYHGSGGLRNATASASVLMKGMVASGSGAVSATEIDNLNALTTAGDRLLNIKNATVVKAYIDYLGSFNAGAGTALLPAYSFVGDPDTGMYLKTVDSIGWSVGGVEKLYLSAGGILYGSIFRGSLLSGQSVKMSIKGDAADGATAIGVDIDTYNALSNAGSKLVTIKNANVEKAYINYLGGFFATTGTASLPAFSFMADPDTGIYGPSNNSLAITTGGAERMIVDGNGYVGIDTSTPAYKFQVFVDTGIEGHVAHDTGAWANSSDSRLKKNIINLDGSLEKIMSLRGVRYDWIKDENAMDSEHIGFIAQELEQIYPEFVSEGNNGIKGVAYGALTPVLVEAIKEQQGQIANLALVLPNNFTSTTLVGIKIDYSVNDTEIVVDEELNNFDWLVKASLKKLGLLIKDGVAKFKELIAGKIIAQNELCVGNTCVNEEQLKNLLQASRQTPESENQNSSSQPTTPPVESPPVEEDELEDTDTNEPTESQTEVNEPIAVPDETTPDKEVVTVEEDLTVDSPPETPDVPVVEEESSAPVVPGIPTESSL